MTTPAVGPERFEIVRLAPDPSVHEVILAAADGAPEALALALRLSHDAGGRSVPIAVDRFIPGQRSGDGRRMYLGLVDHDALCDAEAAARNLRDVLGLIEEEVRKIPPGSPRIAAIIADMRGCLQTAEEALGTLIGALDDVVRSEADDGEVVGVDPPAPDAEGAFPYFKLARWDPVSACWRDGRRAFATEEEAAREADRPSSGAGPFRVSRVEDDGRRIDGPPFRPGDGVY